MLAKRLIQQGLLRKNGIIGGGHRFYGGNGKKVTMNDLPVPSGDWHELHAQRNSYYNTWLAIGVLSFVGTCAFVKTSGIIQFNYAPPSSID